MSRTLMSALLGAACLVSPSLVAAQNLLGNAGFEDPILYASPDPGNWFAFFGAGSAGTGYTADPAFTFPNMPLEGASHLHILNQGAANGFSGVFQSVPVVGGQVYDYSIYAKQLGSVFNIGAEFRVEWKDSMGAEISRTNIPFAASLTEQYQLFSLVEQAPAGAASATAVIAIESFTNPGTDPATYIGHLYVDSTSFAVVPEPASLSLVAMAAAAVLPRRRR